MGRIEADIALESWLFGFWPCSGQGQFTLTIKPIKETSATPYPTHLPLYTIDYIMTAHHVGTVFCLPTPACSNSVWVFS